MAKKPFIIIFPETSSIWHDRNFDQWLDHIKVTGGGQCGYSSLIITPYHVCHRDKHVAGEFGFECAYA